MKKLFPLLILFFLCSIFFNGRDLDINEFFKSIEKNKIVRIEAFLKNGLYINTVNKDGKTALIIASDLGYLDLVKYLVEKGADVNAKSKDGTTPLIIASSWGNIEIVEYLIEKGADVNLGDKTGMTALMRASYNGKLELVKLLIEKGVKVKTRNKSGLTSLDYAEKKDQKEVSGFIKGLSEYKDASDDKASNYLTADFKYNSLRYYEKIKKEQIESITNRDSETDKISIVENQVFTGITKVFYVKDKDSNLVKDISFIKKWIKAHNEDINLKYGMYDLINTKLTRIEVKEDSGNFFVIVKETDLQKIDKAKELKLYFLYLGGFVDKTIFLGILLENN